MKVAIFDCHSYERHSLSEANERFGHDLTFFDVRLNKSTAALAKGFSAICSFVNDRLDRQTLQSVRDGGVELIALRSAGFNHIDLQAADALGIKVTRVPEYSPYAVAEHTVALILTLNRKIHRAYNRVRELNFSLDGLVGFDLHGKTVGIVGTGRIGKVFAKIMHGFGCRLLAYDMVDDQDLMASYDLKYVSIPELLRESDIISLHVPLTPQTKHLLDKNAFAQMKPHAMLVNTGRGALIDTKALIAALKQGKIGYAGLDVYEEEEGVFFEDLSEAGLQDDTLARLLTFPHVLITSHQAFLTKEALQNIADTTLKSLTEFENGQALSNAIKWQAP